ncbi:MAG: hypothetical protein WBG30_05890 [Psychrilyobacter sp.]|uniref:hypothetical protein n=1 Tax=Psychrilyobacter sp. TaxID=2586924 RepID=UPI003C728CA3
MKKTIWISALILFAYGYINLLIIKPFFKNTIDSNKIQKQFIMSTGHKSLQIKIYQNDINDFEHFSKFNIQLKSK